MNGKNPSGGSQATGANMYAIYDWAGNRLSKHGTFKTFEDGWDYILEHWEDEEDHGELYVLRTEEMRKYEL